MLRWSRTAGYAVFPVAVVTIVVLAGARSAARDAGRSPVWPSGTAADTIAHGRYLVVSHACGECHGGGDDPAADGWLAGYRGPNQEFLIGPCALDASAKPCFHTFPRNLTPDNETGLGRFTERQIFNALRYGLRPEDTPDVEITGMTPGQGNYPAHPRYLAPPMPWPSWRHMTDEDLWSIVAYLKRALKPVHNKVRESEGPPDFWASDYAKGNGPYPARPFPTGTEQGGN